MRLVASSLADHACDAEIAPRGVALAVKGPPWLPLETSFEREVSLSTYDLEQLASAGVNMIRLGAMMPGVLPNAPVDGIYHHDQGYVDRLKGFVERAASYGMYTLLEFHQDVISEYYCGEGLPRWAADEVHDAFPAEFEAEVLELLHRLSLDIPGVDHLEDEMLGRFVRDYVHQAQFPMPVHEPFEVRHDGGQQVYSSGDCHKFEWYQYQLSFAAGHAYKRLFNLSSTTFRHVLTYWKVLAEAFRGNPNVLAFDLFNEPHPGSFLTEPWMMSPENADRRLAPFYRAISMAIHQIDPDRLVTFSPVTWEEGGYYLRQMNSPASQMCGWLRNAFRGVPFVGCETFWDLTRWIPPSGIETSAFHSVPLPGQSILSFHFYTPPELNHQEYARKRLADAQRLQVYPLLSETCCLFDSDALQRLYWFEKAQIGWSMWEYKNMANGNGYGAWITGTGPSMFHEDGTPIKEYWRRLAHPSAQFVRGEVLANIFDFTVGTFNLTFVPSFDCRMEGPDAIIVWPWTWWAYINVTSMPRIHVSPLDSAIVQEYVGPSEGYATPVVRFSVQALRRDQVVTVTLSFVNFKNVDLVPEPEEPSVFGPWYQGLGWLLVAGLISAAFVRFLSCCCRRCCCCCPSCWFGGAGAKTAGAIASIQLEEAEGAPPRCHAAQQVWPGLSAIATGKSDKERRSGAYHLAGDLSPDSGTESLPQCAEPEPELPGGGQEEGLTRGSSRQSLRAASRRASTSASAASTPVVELWPPSPDVSSALLGDDPAWMVGDVGL